MTLKILIGKITFTYQAESFFEIIPSGVTVFGLENGNTQAYVGKNQSFELNPPLYSFDLDFIASMSSLTFKFYCYITPTGTQTDQIFLGQVLSNQVDDLFKIKTNLMAPVNFCFNSTGNFFDYFFLMIANKIR